MRRTNLSFVILSFVLALAVAHPAVSCELMDVNADAAMAGSNFGLAILYDGADLDNCFVRSDHPDGETVYSVEFRMRNTDDSGTLGGITMDNFDAMDVFRATGSGTQVLTLSFKKNNAGKLITLAKAKQDNGTNSVLTAVAPTQHRWRIDWQASSGPGNNDGFMRIFKADVCLKEMLSLDNDTLVVNAQQMGSMGPDSTTSDGQTHYDTFVSTRTVEASPTCQQTYFAN